nr:hypothetical protein [Tanacetum cinerariifolium]
LRVHAGRHTSAGGFISTGGDVYAVKSSVQTVELVCAGSIMFLLVDLFLLSPLRYALTHDPPVVFDSLVKQFWATDVVRPNEVGPHDLVATIDDHKVVVTDSLIRTQLQLADANGIFDMPINDIFEADRTPRPTSAFTRKLFANMKFRLAQDPVPLTPPPPPMMAIAAGGNGAGDAPTGAAAGGDAPTGVAAGGDAADEANVVANDAAGVVTEVPQAPQSPPVSPVREPTPERQPTPERPLSPPPSSPETEWVVSDPVSPIADWRPWPYVHVHFSEPESLPFPPEQTFLYEERVEFGPMPRPTGCMGRIATLEKDLGTSKQVMGGSILKLVAAEVAAAKEDDIDLDEITTLATAALESEQPAVPTENVEPMEEQEEIEKELDALMMRMTEADWSNLMIQVAFDGPRFEFLVVHIGMVVITAASCTFFLLTRWFLLVVIIPAG